MNGDEIATVCAWINTNWPHSQMPEESLPIWQIELAQLDYARTLEVLRLDFAAERFAPTPMRLRARVMDRALGVGGFESAMNELLDKVSEVGRYAPEPEWNDPTLRIVVEQRGGWQEVCGSTPSRQAHDGREVGAFGTWSAQFREHYQRAQSERARDATKRMLSIGAAPELDAAITERRREL